MKAYKVKVVFGPKDEEEYGVIANTAGEARMKIAKTLVEYLGYSMKTALSIIMVRRIKE
jgi:hypothetical protein